MYLGKLNLYGMGDTGDSTDPGPPPIDFTTPPAVDIAPPPVLTDSSGNYYSSAPSTPTADGSGFDWSNLFSSAIKTWGSIAVANRQAQTAQSAQQYAYQSQLAARNPYGLRLPGQTYPAGYTPLPGARPATSPISPALILGVLGLGAAAYFLA